MLFAYIGPLSNQTTWGSKSCTWTKNLFVEKKSFICSENNIDNNEREKKNQANLEAFKAIIVAKEIESKVNTI